MESEGAISMLFSMEKQGLFCFYDKVKRLAVLSFQTSSSENLLSAKTWLESLRAAGLPLIGILCDLRNVKRISSLITLFESSQELPLAFIILHPYQAKSIQ